MKKEIINTSASIHQKLLNLARSTNRSFNDLLMIYANERFLYRLSLSPYGSRFILKGALAIVNLGLENPRYTRDIDLLGFIGNSIPDVEQIVHEICETDVIDDGLVFETRSIRGELIKAQDEYPGVRVRLIVMIGKAKVNLQVDIGVGDAVYPKSEKVSFHGLLNLPEAIIRIYQPETILAEKIHALVKHGFINSRMKDIYDIWLIASSLKFNGENVTKALRMTFEKRETPYPEALVIFDQQYQTQSRMTAWKSIGRRLRSAEDLPEFSYVLEHLQGFIVPIINALNQDHEFSQNWDAKEGWGWKKSSKL